MATRTLEDGTIETATLHPDGSLGVTHTDPVTGGQSHYDAARPVRHEPPEERPSWLGLAVAISIALLIAVGAVIAAYR